MNFQFFEELTDEEARVYLKRYLEVESDEVAQSIKQADATADFSIDSIPTFFSWHLQFIKPVRKEPDTHMPDWMRSAHESIGGFMDFADESKPYVLRSSYYLGQSFVTSYPHLRWDLGRSGVAEHNMPVIAGFADGDQMAPMLVAENLIRRALSSPEPVSPIAEAVSVWKKSAETRPRGR